MTKGKKTTQQELAEIVAFCLEHRKDYLLTVVRFSVPCQQIYSRGHKYEGTGIDGLVDGRGRTKPEIEMTRRHGKTLSSGTDAGSPAPGQKTGD